VQELARGWRSPGHHLRLWGSFVRFRLAVSVATAGLALAGAASASAAPPPLPVHIWTSDQGVCFGISEQVPHCVPVSIVKGRPTSERSGIANPVPPVPMPYRHGDEICWDPTPTSKGPCINVPQP
jgi:hypothetical protein